MSSARKKPYASDRTLRRQAAMRTRHHFSSDEPVGSSHFDEPDMLGSENAAPEVPLAHFEASTSTHQTDDDIIDSENLRSRHLTSDDELLNYFTSSDSDDDGREDDTRDLNISEDLKKWIIESGTPLKHATSLLSILRPHFPYLPKDSRTLLRTPRAYEVESVAGGHYHHFGIEEGIRSRLIRNQDLYHNDEIALQINIDGLPLFKSSTECFWPILALVTQEIKPTPFVIGLWIGTSKPNDANAFVQAFVYEMVELQNDGIMYIDKTFRVSIANFICDTPARCFVKRTKGHTGYYGCDYCEQRGVWNNHRMTFPETNASLRTDLKFTMMAYDEHQHGESILRQLNVGMVSKFPLDYMHLICLGVMRKLLSLWISGPLQTRLGSNLTNQISDNINCIKDHMPREFARKGRPLREMDRWKATEFRTFLLYTGPLILRGKLNDTSYDNFMLLHVGISILCSKLCEDGQFCDFAGQILGLFVEHFGELYGKDHLIYNIHGVTHIAGHAKRFGPLHAFSSFPFENYLQTLKKHVRKPKSPLPQAIRRMTEKCSL